jgi:hypothetical protein
MILLSVIYVVCSMQLCLVSLTNFGSRFRRTNRYEALLRGKADDDGVVQDVMARIHDELEQGCRGLCDAERLGRHGGERRGSRQPT